MAKEKQQQQQQKQEQQQKHGGDEAAAAERAKARLEHFKAWLMRFDANGDGHINRRELRDAIRCGGARFASLRAWINLYLADKNRNGVIDDDEIKHLMDLTEKDLDLNKSSSRHGRPGHGGRHEPVRDDSSRRSY